MKNIYQKIVASFYFLTLIGLTFYSPLITSKSEFVVRRPQEVYYTIWGSIWGEEKIDTVKFIYLVLLITVFYLIWFFLLKNKSTPDIYSRSFKRKLKRELKISFISIISFVIFLGFIEVFNLYQENKKEKITEEIYERNLWLSDHISKRPPIKLVDGEQLTVSEFSAKIKAKYPEYKEWDDLVLAKKIVEKHPEYKDNVVFDDTKLKPWKKYDFSEFEPDSYLRSKDSIEFLKRKIVFDPDTNFVYKKYKDEIERLESERDNLFFFVRDGYTKSVFLFLLIELMVLYVLRYLFYGVRSLNNYLKEE